MGRVHEDGGVVLGGGLKAQLAVGGTRVVGEGDAAGQLAIVQDHFVVLGEEEVALCLVFEGALQVKVGGTCSR